MFSRCNLTTLAIALLLASCVPLVQHAEADDAGITDDVDPTQAEEVLDDDSEVGKPAFLIARKHILEDKVSQGRNMTIAVTVYNVGAGDAEDVKITDPDLGDGSFDVLEGSRDQTVGRIEAGGSATIQYVAIPKRGQKGFIAAPAIVTYRSGSLSQKLQSTTPFVSVLSTFQSFEAYLVGLGKIASMGVLKSARDWYNSLIVLVLVGAGAMSFFLVANVSETQAANRRKAAARELGLE